MIICPKCGQPLPIPINKDYVICCGEVLFIIDKPKKIDDLINKKLK